MIQLWKSSFIWPIATSVKMDHAISQLGGNFTTISHKGTIKYFV